MLMGAEGALDETQKGAFTHKSGIRLWDDAACRW